MIYTHTFLKKTFSQTEGLSGDSTNNDITAFEVDDLLNQTRELASREKEQPIYTLGVGAETLLVNASGDESTYTFGKDGVVLSQGELVEILTEAKPFDCESA
jgi:hypothetical protein